MNCLNDVKQDVGWLAKRRQALQESNLLRNSRLETHPFDVAGIGDGVVRPPRQFPTLPGRKQGLPLDQRAWQEKWKLRSLAAGQSSFIHLPKQELVILPIVHVLGVKSASRTVFIESTLYSASRATGMGANARSERRETI